MIEVEESFIVDFTFNKAGYTANTSCEWVGRGGYARFQTFQLDHYGRSDGPTDRRMDGRTKPVIELRFLN